jgi:hypothetical protein
MSFAPSGRFTTFVPSAARRRFDLVSDYLVAARKRDQRDGVR